jgi:hypothetical protein
MWAPATSFYPGFDMGFSYVSHPPHSRTRHGGQTMVGKTVFIFCMSLMAICLTAEGIILLFSGFPLLGQDPLLYAVGCIWTLTSLSMFVFRKRPPVTVALGCLLLAVNAYDLWFHSNEDKSLLWFLYLHSIEIAFIGFSCIGFVLLRRREQPVSSPQMGS